MAKNQDIKASRIRYGITQVKNALKSPDEIRRSVTDTTVLLFAKKTTKYDILIVAVKILNGDGFLITAYQTKRYTKKGELVWPKQQKEQ